MNRKKEKEINQSKTGSVQGNIDLSTKPLNPMKSVQTKSLPTKKVYFSEPERKKSDEHSSK